jgi:pimeloyl-ACP methyl ester carboxylesterase
MTFVLVHGSGFAGSCWDDVVPLLPSPAVAVDLPGRGSRPHALEDVTIDVFADAVADEILGRDLHDVVLVGHSLAGITVPAVVRRVGDRIRAVVFVAASVPADGERVVDSLEPDLRAMAEEVARQPPTRMDPALATMLFCAGMDEAHTARTLSLMTAEGPGLVVEPTSLAGLDAVPVHWVRLARDTVNPPERQDRAIAMLGATVHDLDCGHMAMVTHPAELAKVLGSI